MVRKSVCGELLQRFDSRCGRMWIGFSCIPAEISKYPPTPSLPGSQSIHLSPPLFLRCSPTQLLRFDCCVSALPPPDYCPSRSLWLHNLIVPLYLSCLIFPIIPPLPFFIPRASSLYFNPGPRCGVVSGYRRLSFASVSYNFSPCLKRCQPHSGWRGTKKKHGIFIRFEHQATTDSRLSLCYSGFRRLRRFCTAPWAPQTWRRQAKLHESTIRSERRESAPLGSVSSLIAFAGS